MKNKFTIYKDKKKEYRWQCVASNGRIIADSGEGYKAKQACVKAIKRITGREFRIIER